jgi:hypothetical protein
MADSSSTACRRFHFVPKREQPALGHLRPPFLLPVRRQGNRVDSVCPGGGGPMATTGITEKGRARGEVPPDTISRCPPEDQAAPIIASEC